MFTSNRLNAAGLHGCSLAASAGEQQPPARICGSSGLLQQGRTVFGQAHFNSFYCLTFDQLCVAADHRVQQGHAALHASQLRIHLMRFTS
jgi:hypothetical protein